MIGYSVFYSQLQCSKLEYYKFVLDLFSLGSGPRFECRSREIEKVKQQIEISFLVSIWHALCCWRNLKITFIDVQAYLKKHPEQTYFSADMIDYYYRNTNKSHKSNKCHLHDSLRSKKDLGTRSIAKWLKLTFCDVQIMILSNLDTSY